MAMMTTTMYSIEKCTINKYKNYLVLLLLHQTSTTYVRTTINTAV